MKRIRNNNLVIALAITILFSIPLLTNSIPGFTVDFTYLLTRIEGIKSGLASHDFPIYIYPYVNNGFGYASPLFYPDIFLLIPTFLYCLGIPIIISYKIFIFIISFVTSYLSLLLFEHVLNNKFLSIISCFLYCFSDWIYMPLSWYKGYYYQELDDNGNVILENECVYNEYTKRVGLYMTEGSHLYKVYYKKTVIQKISFTISMVSFGFLCIVTNKRKINND